MFQEVGIWTIYPKWCPVMVVVMLGLVSSFRTMVCLYFQLSPRILCRHFWWNCYRCLLWWYSFHNHKARRSWLLFNTEVIKFWSEYASNPPPQPRVDVTTWYHDGRLVQVWWDWNQNMSLKFLSFLINKLQPCDKICNLPWCPPTSCTVTALGRYWLPNNPERKKVGKYFILKKGWIDVIYVHC